MYHMNGNQNSPLWLKKKNLNQGAYEATSDLSFLHRMQYRLKSAGVAAVPFMKAGDEQTWWKLVFALLGYGLCAQCLCFLCELLFPGQRVQTAGCTQVNELHPQTLQFPELFQSGDLWVYGASDWRLEQRPNKHNKVDAPCCTHQLDWELQQRGREAAACSRAEPRGILWLLEHEAGSCSAACTSTAVCYLNSGYILRLQINFKATNLRCPPTYMFSVLKGLMLPWSTHKMKIIWYSDMQKDKETGLKVSFSFLYLTCFNSRNTSQFLGLL